MRNRFIQEGLERFVKSMLLMIFLKLDQGLSFHGFNVRSWIVFWIEEFMEKRFENVSLLWNRHPTFWIFDRWIWFNESFWWRRKALRRSSWKDFFGTWHSSTSCWTWKSPRNHRPFTCHLGSNEVNWVLLGTKSTFVLVFLYIRKLFLEVCQCSAVG